MVINMYQQYTRSPLVLDPALSNGRPPVPSTGDPHISQVWHIWKVWKRDLVDFIQKAIITTGIGAAQLVPALYLPTQPTCELLGAIIMHSAFLPGGEYS